MSNMLSRVRANVKARSPQRTDNDGLFYPYWSIPVGQTSVIRLLPYLDDVTGGLWAEKKIINMKFVDPDTDKELDFKFPCIEMYTSEEKCPVANGVRDLFKYVKELKDQGESTMADTINSVALSHWLKITGYYQFFVIKNAAKDDKNPENPIRIGGFAKKIHNQIRSSIVDEEDDPFDFLPSGEFDMDDVKAYVDGERDEELMEKFRGRNFLLKMGKQGEFNDYSGSSWASSTDMLTEEQIEAIGKYGFHDLRKFLPERPTEEQLEVAVEMLEVSVNRQIGDGEGLWNPEWEEVGFKKPGSTSSNAGSNSGAKGGTAAAKIGARAAKKGSDTNGDPGENTRSKLSGLMNRGAKKEAEEPSEEPAADETPVEETVAAPAEEANADKKTDRVSALKARISKKAS